MGDLGDQSVDCQWVVLYSGPGCARQCLGDPFMELMRAAILFDHALEGRDLEVARVAGPLQHFEIKDCGNIFHRGAGEHFAGEVEHDHSGREALRHSAEEGLGLWLVQAVLQVIDERRAVDGALIVKRQAEVLGERALTGAVEA
ncbi:hypothetical protein D3C77_326440 [compost metagenome]